MFLYLFAFYYKGMGKKKKQDKLGYWPPDIRGSHSWPRGGGPLWSMCGGGPLGPGGGILGGCRHNRTHFHQLQSRWNISLGLQRCETQDHYTDCCGIRSCRIDIYVHARSSPQARKYICNHTEYPHSLSNQFFHPLTGFLKNTQAQHASLILSPNRRCFACAFDWHVCTQVTTHARELVHATYPQIHARGTRWWQARSWGHTRYCSRRGSCHWG